MKFMNLSKWQYQNPRDKADDGQQGGSGGEADDKISISQSELNTLVANSVAAALAAQNKPKDDEESLSEKRERERVDAEKLKERDLKNQQFALRNIQFDTFIGENSKHLPESMKTIRADVEKSVSDKSDLSVSVPLMWGTAAKEFFSDEKNMQFLTKSDQDWVKANVLAVRYEKDIDGVEAAKYMERAIDALKRKADDVARRSGNSGDHSQYDGHENVKNYLNGFLSPIENRYKQATGA